MSELVERLHLSPSRVRRLLEDQHLAGKRVNGVLCVPELFLDGPEPLPELRGTLIVLADNGFSHDESVDWMLMHEDSLGTSPILALRSGRKAEVRRIAQALA